MSEEIAALHARDVRAHAERARRAQAAQVTQVIQGWRPREDVGSLRFGWRGRSARMLVGVAARLIGACADELWRSAEQDALRATR